MGIVVIPQHDHTLVWDAFTEEYLRFDGTQARKLVAWARGRERVDVDGDAFGAQLAERGFVGFDGRLVARCVEPPTHADRTTGPLLVHVEVNAVCNLTCTHCFAAPMPRREHARPLDLEELDELFRQMAALGSMRVSLTGGEPLLRPDLFEVVDAAVARGLSVALTTNGLLIDDDVAKRLARTRLRWLNVSLEGGDAATNDDVRGAGVFDRVRVSLARLRAHDVPFALAFTLTAHNIDDVDACIGLAAREGAGAAVFRPLYPVGAAAARPDLLPGADDVKRAFARIHSLAAAGAACGLVDGPSGCGAGRSVCSFDVGGRASPCGFLGEGFLGASIRDTPLAELWASPIFASMRHDDAAGCRVRAQAATGSAYGVDPWLSDEPRVGSPRRTLHILQDDR